MSRFPRSLNGGRNLTSVVRGQRRHFPRDKRRLLSNKRRMFRLWVGVLGLLFCTTTLRADLFVPANRIIISVRDQKLMLLQDGGRVATFPVSTSKFGLGDSPRQMTTPLGFLQVAQKIGDNAPDGAVFHNRRLTGEVLRPNAPGRDPIVTRIIWLRGLERSNLHAYNRCIYIHGTPEERTIGRPASYGCIRMRSRDVAALYSQVPIGTVVQIVPDRLPKISKVSTRSKAKPAEEINEAPEDWATSAHSQPKPASRAKDALAISGRGA